MKFLSYSKEKIEAFNRRVKMAQKEMSRAMNLINPKERVSLLVVSWFIAPDGSPLKPLIMRKILQNFFQIKPGGKTAGSLKKEKENNAKQ
ncbi:MAG: hypothetical protein ACPGTS_01085 [Minisyncoccia bacterium]